MRSVLELAVPAWNAALAEFDKRNIERVQNTALRIMFGLEYILDICLIPWDYSCPISDYCIVIWISSQIYLD